MPARVVAEKKPEASVGARPLRVLMVENSEPDVELCLHELRRAGYHVTADVVVDIQAFAQRLQAGPYDIVLSDFNLGGFNGMDVFVEFSASGKDIPFILVSGTIGEDRAVDCIKLGVTDYVIKDRIARLPLAVSRALDARSIAQQHETLSKHLRDSEATLGLLFAQLPATVWTTDRDLRVISLNGMGLPRLGWRADQVLGHTLQEIYLTDDRDHPPIAAHRRALLGKSASYEYRHSQRDFSVSVEPLRDSRGLITGCLSLALDVTEQRRAQQEIKEANQLLETLIESSPLPIVAMHRTGAVFRWNPAAESTFGWKKAEVLGQQFPFTPPEKSEEAQSLLNLILQGGTFSGIEVRRKKKDGSDVELSLSAAPLRNAAGEVYGAISVIADFTQRKRAEADRQRLSTAVQQSAGSIVITDPDGIINYVNPAFIATTGYSREEAIGKSTRLLKSGRQDGEFYERLWRTITAGETWRGEIVNQRKDGSLYTADMSITPVRDETGTIVEYIAIQNDITEKRALERQLIQAQRQEAIGQLAGGIAHDFNNVLGAVLGMAELALMEAPPGSKLGERLEKIQHHAGRAVALTRQLVAFARRLELERRDINLNHAVAEIVSLIGETLGKDIELHTRLAPDLPATYADPGQVEQILLNLCINARDAMPRGGQLFIETENFTLDEESSRLHPGSRPGPYVRLTVSDTGAGMDAKTIEHIFEPYFTTKGPGKGTGLGLATVYGIVKQHDGFIQVYSEPGDGATFRIYFPVSAPKPVEEPASATQTAVRGGNETILVADDQEGLRDFLRESLEALGYRVLAAGDGEEALQVFTAHQSEIDLLVLDVVMPKLRGPDLYARISSQKLGLPVIFCSGYSAEAPQVLAAGAPAFCVLQKPYSVKSLAQKVRALLDAAQRD